MRIDINYYDFRKWLDDNKIKNPHLDWKYYALLYQRQLKIKRIIKKI